MRWHGEGILPPQRLKALRGVVSLSQLGGDERRVALGEGERGLELLMREPIERLPQPVELLAGQAVDVDDLLYLEPGAVDVRPPCQGSR
jgi:hypothetical protein